MEGPPIEWTTYEILKMLGINTQGSIKGIQEDMLTKHEGKGQLNDEDSEGI